MRNKVSSIIAFISIALYAAAIGIGIIRILAGVNERRVVAQREFYDLADVASSAGALGFMDEPFKDAVRDAVVASQTLQAVIITGPFGAEFTYDRDNTGIIAWEGDTPRFQRRFGVSRNPHFSPLRVDGLRNATIQAVSATIDYAAFSRILLQSLFLVLASVILSAVTMLIYHIKGKDALVSEKMQEIYPSKPEQAAASVEPGPTEPAKDDREARIQEKLDAELGICSITDKDLALILMELSLTAGFGVGDDASVNRKVVARARQFFDSQALVYERGGRGLALILSGEGLEETFSKARQFHDLIITELPELFPHKNDLRLGISSRNKRLVRANRLLLEASRALDKANLEPESPIVAFKSDPEKYKTFVRSQGRKTTTK
jgi:GGDEF domain-containing protein